MTHLYNLFKTIRYLVFRSRPNTFHKGLFSSDELYEEWEQEAALQEFNEYLKEQKENHKSKGDL